MNYEESGVSLFNADMIATKLSAKYPWLGGFAGLYDIGNDYIVASTDGIGTKMLLGSSNPSCPTTNLGQDLVAMSVNDVICTGAKPLFFLDYIALGKLDVEFVETQIDGIINSLDTVGIPLLGGETSEMPDLYDEGQFDMSGFCVGAVPKEKYALLDGSRIGEGDVLIGLASSGPHSNGYSLIRKIIEKVGSENSPIDDLLEPTKLYSKTIRSILSEGRVEYVHGIANITGGGRDNILRLLGDDINLRPDWDYSNVVDPNGVFDWIEKEGQIGFQEMHRVFNMGVGMILIVNAEYANTIMYAINDLEETAWRLGDLVKRI